MSIFCVRHRNCTSMVGNLNGFWKSTSKIVCVGRNYKDHALELGNAVPEKPIFFSKSTNSFVNEGEQIRIPPGCKNLNQEVELGVVIGKTAKNIKRDQAYDFIGGYVAALDMTARDFQDEFKKVGHPWYLSKSFDTSCPISNFVAAREIGDPHKQELYCFINGEEKQRCTTNQMIFDIPTLLEYLTKYVTLYVDDLLLTGTPAGVCRVQTGDVIKFGMKDRISATFHVS